MSDDTVARALLGPPDAVSNFDRRLGQRAFAQRHGRRPIMEHIWTAIPRQKDPRLIKK
jgi:hypothetical protein